MALKFDMSSPLWAMQMNMQRQQAVAGEVGQDVGAGLYAAGDWWNKNKSKTGKAYQKYLTDPKNFEQKEFDIIDGKKVKNANFGKWKGPQKTFSQFKTGFKAEQKMDRLITKAKKLGVHESEGYKEFQAGGGFKTFDEYKKELGHGGELNDAANDILQKEYMKDKAKYAESTDNKGGALGDYLKTDEGEKLFKDMRSDKFNEGVQDFSKGALKIGGGALGIGMGIANPALAVTAGLGYGMSKLPGADKRSENKAKRQAKREERRNLREANKMSRGETDYSSSSESESDESNAQNLGTSISENAQKEQDDLMNYNSATGGYNTLPAGTPAITANTIPGHNITDSESGGYNREHYLENRTKAPGFKGFMQRVIPGGERGYNYDDPYEAYLTNQFKTGPLAQYIANQQSVQPELTQEAILAARDYREKRGDKPNQNLQQTFSGKKISKDNTQNTQPDDSWWNYFFGTGG